MYVGIINIILILLRGGVCITHDELLESAGALSPHGNTDPGASSPLCQYEYEYEFKCECERCQCHGNLAVRAVARAMRHYARSHAGPVALATRGAVQQYAMPHNAGRVCGGRRRPRPAVRARIF